MSFSVGENVEVNKRIDPRDESKGRVWTPAKVIERKIAQDRQSYIYRVEFADGTKMIYNSALLRKVAGAAATPAPSRASQILESNRETGKSDPSEDEFWAYYTGLGPHWRDKIAKGLA